MTTLRLRYTMSLLRYLFALLIYVYHIHSPLDTRNLYIILSFSLVPTNCRCPALVFRAVVCLQSNLSQVGKSD
jgi:hypothetical protein